MARCECCGRLVRQVEVCSGCRGLVCGTCALRDYRTMFLTIICPRCAWRGQKAGVKAAGDG